MTQLVIATEGLKTFFKNLPLRTLQRFWYNAVDEGQMAGATETRRKFFALSDGDSFPSLLIIRDGMDAKTISIFVDESGSFTYPDEMSPYYLVGLVLHDQDKAVLNAIARYERELDLMGFTHLCFHAGPIIRREECFQPMNWQLRSRIFKKMLAFARQVDYRYHCLFVNKRFVTSIAQITTELKQSLASFLDDRFAEFSGYDVIKVYYDHGQAEVNTMLKETFTAKFGGKVEFVPDVKPEKYKLFQLADLICTVSLIARKLDLGYPMTNSEHRFFGGPRVFLRNVLRSIKPKEI